jgi:hypothetical protein
MFKNQVKKITKADIEPVRAMIGTREGMLFGTRFDLKIDGDKLPGATAANLITELKALFEKHGASCALTVERQFKPTQAFYASRHKLFTVEQNIEIDACAPVITSVKVKGVK